MTGKFKIIKPIITCCALIVCMFISTTNIYADNEYMPPDIKDRADQEAILQYFNLGILKAYPDR